MKIKPLPVFLGIVCANVVVLGIIFTKKDTKQKPTDYKQNQILKNTTSNSEIGVEFVPFTSDIKILNSLEERKDGVENLKIDLQELSGIYGFTIKNIKTGEIHEYNTNQQFFGASLYKIPLAMATIYEVENGDLAYSYQVFYKSSDFADGSGEIQDMLEDKSNYSIEELLNFLLINSDNIAQSMLSRTLTETQVRQQFENYAYPASNSDFYNQNLTNPKEIALMFEKIHNDYQINPPKYNVIETLKNTDFDNRIHKGLYTSTQFAHKIGNWAQNGTWHDCGIIFKENEEIYSICLMSKRTTYVEFEQAAIKIGNLVEGF